MPKWVFLALGLAAAVLLVGSRVIYAPRYLFYFDSVNFALAIQHFDPRAHQPQPPGYPLFVALLKLLDLITHDARLDLEFSGLIGSAAGIGLVWLWTTAVFGRRAGWAAAALLLMNPVFWIAGIVNPVRTFLVVVVGACALLSWKCLIAPNPRPWFYVAAAALGGLSGFRPECLALLFPLWTAIGFYRKLDIHGWWKGSGILAVTTLLWLTPLVVRTGGIVSTYHLFSHYLLTQSRGYTLFFGAGAKQSQVNVYRVLIWNFESAIAWIWAIPFAWRRLRDGWTQPHTLLLGFSFVPPFLFHALVHVRNVDQTLITIPVVCVLGGAVLSRLPTRPAVVAATAFALLVNFSNFRRPVLSEMNAASRGEIRYVNDWTKSTFAALDPLRQDHNAAWIWGDSIVSWRQVSYYYPENHVLDLESDVPMWLYSRQGTLADCQENVVIVPVAHRLVLGVSYGQANTLAALPGAERRGPLVILPWGPGAEVRVGRYILRNPAAE